MCRPYDFCDMVSVPAVLERVSKTLAKLIQFLCRGAAGQMKNYERSNLPSLADSLAKEY